VTAVNTPDTDTVIYCGSHRASNAPGPVWVERGGHLVGVLTHRTGARSHSPTGFSWGYGGSGPAELARAMLIDALGDEAVCPTCRGAGMVAVEEDETSHEILEVPWTGDPDGAPDNVMTCLDCDRDGVRRLPYQQFKWDIIARLPDEWTIPRADVLAWWAQQTTTGDA
jgi:hypothetical protein